MSDGFDKNEWKRKRRAEALANGMCGCCCVRPCIEGTKRCAECVAYQRERKVQKRSEQGLLDKQICRGGCKTVLPKDGPRLCEPCALARSKAKLAMFKRRPWDPYDLLDEDIL